MSQLIKPTGQKFILQRWPQTFLQAQTRPENGACGGYGGYGILRAWLSKGTRHTSSNPRTKTRKLAFASSVGRCVYTGGAVTGSARLSTVQPNHATLTTRATYGTGSRKSSTKVCSKPKPVSVQSANVKPTCTLTTTTTQEKYAAYFVESATEVLACSITTRNFSGKQFSISGDAR